MNYPVLGNRILMLTKAGDVYYKPVNPNDGPERFLIGKVKNTRFIKFTPKSWGFRSLKKLEHIHDVALRWLKENGKIIKTQRGLS